MDFRYHFLFSAATTLVTLALAIAAPSGDLGSPNGISPARSGAPCPPPNFGNLTSLSLAAYISAPWYIQKQIPLDYQPLDEAFCVRAEYEPLDPKNISAGVLVNNYANKGAVNGPTMGSSKYDRSNTTRLIAQLATFKAKGRDGKLLVGPEILLKVLPAGAWRTAFGPYWIVAVGYSQNITLRYDWAIVSGGAPTFISPKGTGCTTVPYKNGTAPVTRPAGAPAGGPFGPSASFDLGGLWFLTRKPVDTVLTAKMEARAKALGLDTSQMISVQQNGCLYKL